MDKDSPAAASPPNSEANEEKQKQKLELTKSVLCITSKPSPKIRGTLPCNGFVGCKLQKDASASSKGTLKKGF